jgi:hypothetical protein
MKIWIELNKLNASIWAAFTAQLDLALKTSSKLLENKMEVASYDD